MYNSPTMGFFMRYDGNLSREISSKTERHIHMGISTFPNFPTFQDTGHWQPGQRKPLPGCDDQGAGWRTVTFLGFLGPLWGSYSPPGGVASDSPGEFQFGGPFCTSEAMRSKSCWPFVHLTIRYYMILYVLNSHQSDGNMTTSIYKYLRVSTNIIK